MTERQIAGTRVEVVLRRHHPGGDGRHRERGQHDAARRGRRRRGDPSRRRPRDPRGMPAARRVPDRRRQDHHGRTTARPLRHPHGRPRLPRRPARRAGAAGQRVPPEPRGGSRARRAVGRLSVHLHRGVRLPDRRCGPDRPRRRWRHFCGAHPGRLDRVRFVVFSAADDRSTRRRWAVWREGRICPAGAAVAGASNADAWHSESAGGWLGRGGAPGAGFRPCGHAGRGGAPDPRRDLGEHLLPACQGSPWRWARSRSAEWPAC